MAIAKLETIIRSVTQTIAAEVLPVAPTGWPASYLRSAIMLLTYVEDRSTLWPELLAEDDRDLCSLLEASARILDLEGEYPGLTLRIKSACEANGPLEETWELRRAALCDLIEAVYESKRYSVSSKVAQIAIPIAIYRANSLDREGMVWRRAELLPLM